MLSNLFQILAGVIMVAYGIVCIRPQATIYPIQNRRLRNRMIREYQLTNLQDLERNFESILSMLILATKSRRYRTRLDYDQFDQPEVREYFETNHATNLRATVEHIMALIAYKLEP